MNAAIDSSNTAVGRLVRRIDDENPYEASADELLPLQLEALNERFQSRVNEIKLLANRAEAGGIREIRRLEDVVPLLFAHTAYKSYPESWLIDQQWERLTKWLDTVSTYRVKPVDAASVKNLDDWLEKLGQAGHFVSCSSGTTGKCAMMNATQFDLDFSGRQLLQGLIWTGIAPNRDRIIVALGQTASTPRNRTAGLPMMQALCRPDAAPLLPNVPPITIGGIVEMIVLRKKIAEGTAKPSELAFVEAQTAERTKAMELAVEQSVENIIANRGERLHILGMFGPLYQVAERVRARGYSGKAFQENSSFISGGLKRAQLPANYREFIFETFNLSNDRVAESYGMQELNTNAFRCKAGRYHVPPWMVLLLLDEPGENLIPPPASGEIEGRAAFVDLSLDGRWGGVISGDKIRATWVPCKCGNRSPSIHPDIQRYADTASGDKIACAGTIDAYVRGIT